jgi:hypothetical protein
MGRMGGNTRPANEREEETEKDAFSRKSCFIQKMKTDNVWGKKCSATDCSTKQNKMIFFCAGLCLRVASAGGAESIILSDGGAESIILSAGGTESMMLSACAESMIVSVPLAASMILLALLAENMMLSAPFDSVITLTP